MDRRLAAIVAADIVGYSRLMEADEEGTIERQKAHRAQLIDPLIARYKGRIVKTIGDGLLIEFQSVVDAVRCAVDMQGAVTSCEAEFPKEQRILYRIGVNLGDILVDGDDILGDGVNVAARLEQFADPGGICISGSVASQVQGKVDTVFEDIGERSLKNIKQPCRIWRWTGEKAAATEESRIDPPDDRSVPVPVIAILPFDCLGADAETKGFTDGLTDEIIAAFSRQTGMTVLARNLTRGLNGKAVDMLQIGKNLGAHYVLEGSVRSAGSRVRVMTQLTETTAGRHLWGDQFDGDLSDMFSLQDEVTFGISAAVRSQIHLKDAKRARNLPREELSDGELLALASQRMQALSVNDFREAAALTEIVISRNRDNAMAFAMSASCFLLLSEMDYRPISSSDAAIADERISRSIQLNEESDYAHYVRGRLLLHFHHQIDLSIAEAERALELNPNYTYAHALLGFGMVCSGDLDRGIPIIEKALRADSRRAGSFNFMEYLSLGHFSAKQYAAALDWRLKAAQRAGYQPWTRFFLASCYALDGRMETAAEHLGAALEVVPDATIEALRRLPFRDEEVNRRFHTGLLKAGMPD